MAVGTMDRSQFRRSRMATAQTPLTISITPNAAKHVGEFITHGGKNEGVLRVAVKGGGCSGLTYVLDIVDEAREDDKIVSDQGIKLAVDRKSYVFLAGTVLDYSSGLNGRGFIFENPNAKKGCGCGTSFSV
jgi:iron-sulfur cluster assembly protein